MQLSHLASGRPIQLLWSIINLSHSSLPTSLLDRIPRVPVQEPLAAPTARSSNGTKSYTNPLSKASALPLTPDHTNPTPPILPINSQSLNLLTSTNFLARQSIRNGPQSDPDTRVSLLTLPFLLHPIPPFSLDTRAPHLWNTAARL